ncbi:MAG: hypothetical protein HUJ80_00115, partial [Firmicutes bacterium]|nr:hypothetical protein [Bacillota bacterium]
MKTQTARSLRRMGALFIALLMVFTVIPAAVYADYSLSAPTNLRWDGTKATWDPVPTAMKYKIDLYIDGARGFYSAYPYDQTYLDLSGAMERYGSHSYAFTVTVVDPDNMDSRISPESAQSPVYIYTEEPEETLTPITSVTITGLNVPAAGANPDRTVTVTTVPANAVEAEPQIIWFSFEDGEMSDSDSFESQKTYQARLIFKPAEGYEFQFGEDRKYSGTVVLDGFTIDRASYSDGQKDCLYLFAGSVFLGAHEHDWGTDWRGDETHHWHPYCKNAGCTVTQTSEMGGYGAHVWKIGVSYQQCTVCGYTEYSLTDASKDQTWQKGSEEGLTFILNAPLSRFENVYIDDTECDYDDSLAGENYILQEGSIKVTLKPSYLQTLALGTHRIDINALTYDDSETDPIMYETCSGYTEFTVAEDPAGQQPAGTVTLTVPVKKTVELSETKEAPRKTFTFKLAPYGNEGADISGLTVKGNRIATDGEGTYRTTVTVTGDPDIIINAEGLMLTEVDD